jgi:hypothetical protein
MHQTLFHQRGIGIAKIDQLTNLIRRRALVFEAISQRQFSE